MTKLRKTILALLLGGFAFQCLAAIWLQLSYFSSLPKVPDDTAGRICRMIVQHGSVRYGSERELYVLQTVESFQPVAILLFLLAVVLGMSWGIFKITPSRKLNE